MKIPLLAVAALLLLSGCEAESPATLRASEAPEPTGECHDSYPDFCIPPAPPDLDCADVAGKRFRVRAPDPHGFDGDYDGIGCER